MALLRGILRILFSEPGASDLVLTKTAKGVRLRLADETSQSRWPLDAMIPVAIFGGVATLPLVVAALPDPAGHGDFLPLAVGLPIIALVACLVYLRIRFTWHHELILTPTESRQGNAHFSLKKDTTRAGSLRCKEAP